MRLAATFPTVVGHRGIHPDGGQGVDQVYKWMHVNNSMWMSSLKKFEMAMKQTLMLAALTYAWLVANCSSAFDLPFGDGISELFSDFMQRMKDSETGGSEDNSGRTDEGDHDRIKRQTSNIGDESPNPYEIRSSILPLETDGVTVNTRYMPTIGNGHIGATIYDDSIFLNGLYTGTGGHSHRAQIPAIMMGRIRIGNDEIDRRASRKYTLNALEGYFMESIDCEYGQVFHKIYMHQKYIRLFVVDTYAVLKRGAYGGMLLELQYPSINITDDITFSNPTDYQAGSKTLTGTTKSAEVGEETQQVNVFYTVPLTQMPLVGTLTSLNITQVMAIDKVQANARQEFDLAQTMLRGSSPAQLFEEHAEAWRKAWSTGRLELKGSDNQLMKAVWFAQYYLLSSLPAEQPFLPPPFTEPFYGLSRTGLGKGKAGKDYQGHVMWDNEYYMLPAVLPFHPVLAKSMLRYRSATARKAAENAKLFNGVGYHYAWESGTSGAEVSPDTCPSSNPRCHWDRFFVTAGVSFAIRLYYSMTRDRDYMTNTYYAGCDVSREVAKFLADQLVYSPDSGRFEMRGMTGPDEFHPNVTNNAFTMCATSLAIHWARYFSCLCQRNERDEVPDEFVLKALYLNLPYDRKHRMHFQHEGFDPIKDSPIKQADTIMLNYPLNWNYSVDIMKNDLEFYEPLTSDKTPAMTYSWFTIGWKWVNEQAKTRHYFLKSYQDYIIQPFKIWTEYTERNPSDQAAGNVNFLPGMGAFLQSIIYGFAGFRIRPDRLEVFNPIPPPGADTIYLRGFQYLGTNMTFTITSVRTTISVHGVSQTLPMILRRNQTGAAEESITAGATITIMKSETNGFFIYPSIAETCEHPRDYVFIWDYGLATSASLTVGTLTAAALISQLLIVCMISRR